MSDVHLEFNSDLKFLEDYDFNGVDAIVIAGDFTVEESLRSALICLMDKVSIDTQVIFVPGNHEYYHSDKQSVEKVLLGLEGLENFNWLRPGKVVQIKGVSFFGSTMWYRKSIFHDQYKMNMNDYHLIDRHESWVFDQNLADRYWISKCLENISGPKVVVTHHAPSFASVDGRYVGSPLNDFYVCNMEEVILNHEPDIWCHGHMHYPKDYMIGKTRIVANPRGYTHKDGSPMEGYGFEPDKIFEIQMED